MHKGRAPGSPGVLPWVGEAAEAGDENMKGSEREPSSLPGTGGSTRVGQIPQFLFSIFL